MSEERQTFAVTPPGGDVHSVRAWLESMAVDKGWTDLEWTDEVDQHGNAMGRLMGSRPTKVGE
jgi:hypothetical protein